MRFPWKRLRRVNEMKDASITEKEDTVAENGNSTPPQTGAHRHHHKKRRKASGWLDTAITEHEKDGGFDDLPGKGKPLKLDPNEDAFASTLKNAGALPMWLALQHEIRDQIGKTIQLMERRKDFGLESAIQEINAKIRQYNTKCPSPLLQKPLLNEQNIATQYERWK